MSGLGARVFARLVVGARWLIVPGWIALAILSAVFLPIPSSSEGEQVADLVPQDAPAVQAELASIKDFAFPLSAGSPWSSGTPRACPPRPRSGS